MTWGTVAGLVAVARGVQGLIQETLGWVWFVTFQNGLPLFYARGPLLSFLCLCVKLSDHFPVRDCAVYSEMLVYCGWFDGRWPVCGGLAELY